MDESGKNLISDPQQDIYLFGGMILDSQQVFQAIETFKPIYQRCRNYLKKVTKEALDKAVESGEIDEKMLQKTMDELFATFELHAVQMFNPYHKMKKGRIKHYNPWTYSDPTVRFQFLTKMITDMLPFISEISIYKVTKEEINDFFTRNNITPSDKFVDKAMIEFIIKEYNHLLEQDGKKGVLIPDKLDSGIREEFVVQINKHNANFLWAEPIVVESYYNAFTQLIDLLTYTFYLVETNANTKPNFKGIQRLYHKHMKKHVKVKELCADFLEKQQNVLTKK
ncbi:DUF3800 domain-containing protein [Bacillus cereus]|uniref:DUF3800 domain-containing protein n=1 Tax=Bacillus cereus TaxID=1396 RepID=UPI00112505BB|nr:DUF3800 domain-containing protein [Bacillus cereus]